MATNPNVPVDAKVAAETSAPNATVTAQQPAQMPSGVQPAAVSPLTAIPVQAAPVHAAPVQAAAQPTNGVKMDQTVANNRKDELNKEQEVLQSVIAAAEGKDYFEQQEVFGRAFEEREGEDSFRRAVRIERERESLMSAGDPTRDPVAKQKAMDMNTVQPGALADAQKIKDIGSRALDEQSVALKGVK